MVGASTATGVDDDEQINRGEIDGADLSMSRSVEEWRRGDDEAEGERWMVWTRGAGETIMRGVSECAGAL